MTRPVSPAGLLLLLACASTAPPRVVEGPAPFRASAAPSVGYRPGDPLPALGEHARIDRGLRAAAEELASVTTRPDSRLTPSAVRIALGRAGYPGEVHFVRFLGGTDLPSALTDDIPRDGPVDVGWAWRDLGDGRRVWLLGWSERRASVDPLPRDLRLDQGVALRVDGVRDPRLFVGLPDGAVREIAIDPGKARWLDVFHVPGEYRLEVIDGQAVDLLFSLYVDAEPAPPTALPGPPPPPSTFDDQRALYRSLNEARAAAGLPPTPVFGLFEGVARAHATCLASIGLVAHVSPKCPGVPSLAARLYHPRAKHHEDVAAGDTALEAWERLNDSPAHRANMLCRTCSHSAIGMALEPATPPRVFVVWELLEFPEGLPAPIGRF